MDHFCFQLQVQTKGESEVFVHKMIRTPACTQPDSVVFGAYIIYIDDIF